MTTSRIPIEKQIRDTLTILDVIRRGEKLKRAEFHLLEPSLLEALRTMEFCRDNGEVMRAAAMKARGKIT
jgi:hypothetical protein